MELTRVYLQLEELGFETGKKVEVTCEQGELIIRLAEE
ncbi:SymE family type I addiction module toxin [Pantoea sp. MBD-2R]